MLMRVETKLRPPAIKIVRVGQYEGVMTGLPGPTATITVVPAQLVWLGRNSLGDLTEILWDPETAVFLPDDFEALRDKTPFKAFTILTRAGGPATAVRAASELFVGDEAIIVKSSAGSVATIPLRAIQAVELCQI